MFKGGDIASFGCKHCLSDVVGLHFEVLLEMSLLETKLRDSSIDISAHEYWN
jgi:hypothetical protein